MRIFLTGGTGYIGEAVLQALAARHDVTALVRGDAQAARIRAVGATPLVGDLARVFAWSQVAREADVIVHCGIASGADRLDIDAAVVDALCDAQRLIYTSVLFVLGDIEGGTEESRLDPPPYAEMRARQEQRVLANPTGAVIRPGMVYGGTTGGAINGMIATGSYVGDGTNRWSLVHRDDVASLFALVVERQATGIFHAVDGNPMRVADVARAAGVTQSIPRDEARKTYGAFADALCLDQAVYAPRSLSLGWQPTMGSDPPNDAGSTARSV